MARFKILNKFTEWLLPTDDNTIYFVEGDATTPNKIKVGDTTFAEANPTDVVKYSEQDLTNEEQAQARANIGAMSTDAVLDGENIADDSVTAEKIAFDAVSTKLHTEYVAAGGRELTKQGFLDKLIDIDKIVGTNSSILLGSQIGDYDSIIATIKQDASFVSALGGDWVLGGALARNTYLTTSLADSLSQDYTFVSSLANSTFCHYLGSSLPYTSGIRGTFDMRTGGLASALANSESFISALREKLGL